MANERAAAFEAACLAGTPADAKYIAEDTVGAEKLMDAYFKLTAKSSSRDFKRVFATEKPDMSWVDANGPMSVDKLSAGPSETLPRRSRLAFVEAGDQKSSRAIWSVATDSGTVYYAVDFVYFHTWFDPPEIWHMTITRGPTPPATPHAYCHFGSELVANQPSTPIPQRPPPSTASDAHVCTHNELNQARVAWQNGYTSGPHCL
jgi:hypothetical protein